MNGYLAKNGDVATIMPSLHISRFILPFIFFGNVWKTLAKSIPDQGTLDVLIRVQVFDNSDLSPLADAAAEVYGNQSTLASCSAGRDGVAMVTFQYRPGTWVIIAASKQGYITNSAPWHASRLPLYASVSLYLLPQRPATLILYDDVVQVLLGSPGARNQPWVQFQRKAIHLPQNSSYLELSAVLTAAKTQYEIGGFPYLLGQEINSTGDNGNWLDLTAVAAVSTDLFARNGSAVQVSEPVHISIPLPSDTLMKAATSIPVWKFEAKTGLWVRNGTGYINKEGLQLTWSFVAPHLGYWVAAMPSSAGMSLNPTGLRDITTYHTIFLLTILGFMALLVLILLCLLLYYCRRRCLKPRQQHRKMHASSTLEGSKRDQGTSTSRLNLISGGHVETASSNGDMDGIKSDLSSSREEFFRHVPAHKLRHAKGDGGARRGESFPMKVTRSTDTNSLDPPLLQDDYTRSYSSMDDKGSDSRRHNANDNQGYSSDPPSPPGMPPPFVNHYQGHNPDSKPPEYSMTQPTDHLARPTSLNTQPGQLIFCGSIDQMKENMYRSMVPTLVIPAHYMRLSSDFSGVEQMSEQQQQQQQQHNIEAIQMGLTSQQQAQQQQQQQQQVGQQAVPPGEDPEGRGWGPNPSSGPVRIPVLFNDSTMAQMNGELQALTEKKLLELGVKQHPRAWFISLDGRSNHVRHSYIDLGNERAGRGPNLDSGMEVKEGKPGPALHRKGKGKGKEERRGGERKDQGGKVYTKLAYLDDMEPSSSDSRTAMCSPEDNSLTPLLDEALELRGATIPRQGRSRVNSSRSSNSELQRDSMTSPEDENDLDDKGENKKSPWQRLEERPLMVFNVKK